jgi:transcriptional regulator with XRE-family HTH domain
MNIGIVIKEVRKQKGLTQLDLSEHANLSERTIQRIENNEVEPSFYSLKCIGEILEIDLHLSSIARMRSIQLRNRKILMISVGIIVSALIIVEVLAALGVLA